MSTVYALVIEEGHAEEIGKIIRPVYATRAAAEAALEAWIRRDYEELCHPERWEEGHYMERLEREQPEFHAQRARQAREAIEGGYERYRAGWRYLGIEALPAAD